LNSLRCLSRRSGVRLGADMPATLLAQADEVIE
jgi:hypothetical protein